MKYGNRGSIEKTKHYQSSIVEIFYTLTPYKAITLLKMLLCVHRNGEMQRSSIALVGFSDGYIRAYSKSGQMVFSQQLHMDAVVKFSLMWSASLSSEQQVIIIMQTVYVHTLIYMYLDTIIQ